jgi:hypothetical protein
MREVNLTHTIRGDENFTDNTLASVGIPPLHVVRATNGREFRFYELNGDLEEALHFDDFTEAVPSPPHSHRVQLGDKVEEELADAEKKIHLID